MVNVAKCRLFSQACLGRVLKKKPVSAESTLASDYEEKLTPLPKPTSLSARFDCQNSTCVCSDCLALTKVDPARQAKVFICEPPQDFKAKDIQKHADNMLPLYAKTLVCLDTGRARIKLLKQRRTNLALFIWRRVGPANYTVPENTNDLDVAACKESNVQ